MGYFPSQINIKQNTLEFVELDQQALAPMSFHDRGITQDKPVTQQIELDHAAVDHSAAPMYIFHTSFVGSTLLSRVLAASGQFYSLREPSVLRDLGDLYSQAPDKLSTGIAHVLNGFMHFNPSPAPLMLKPSDACNHLIPALLGQTPQSKSIWLYNTFDEYLVSLFKLGDHGLAFARQRCEYFCRIRHSVLAPFRDEIDNLSDWQCAALNWYWQQHQFALAREQLPAHQLIACRGSDFLTDIYTKAVQFSEFFGQPLSQADRHKLKHSAVLTTHAKGDYAFDNRQREQINQQVRASHHGLIAEAESYLATLNPPNNFC